MCPYHPSPYVWPLMRDFPFLHVVVSAVIHKQSESGAHSRDREKREGEDGRQGQIAAFNRLPRGAAEGDRESVRGRRIWGEKERGSIEREMHCSKRKIKNVGWLSERRWNMHALFRRHSVGIKGVQMGEYTHAVHTYSEARDTCGTPHPTPSLSHSAMHFIYNKVFLWGIHLSELFSSHFCHIHLSVPSWSFSTFPVPQSPHGIKRISMRKL